MSTSQNLVINFNLNKKTDDPRYPSLTDQLLEIKRRYGDGIFPAIEKNDGDRLFEYFVDLFFSNGIQGVYFISNTSLYDDRYDITIRPNLSEKPRLNEELPKNITLCVRGNLHPEDLISPTIRINRINDIANSGKKDFEVESNITTYISDINNRMSGHPLT